MLDKIYGIVNGFILRYKLLVLGLIGVIVVISALHLKEIQYDNHLETMLPAHQEVMRNLQFLRESGFSNKVIVDLRLTAPSKTTEDLIQAVDLLAGSLHGPLITSVTSGFAVKNLQEDIRSFLRLSPQMIPAGELYRLGEKLTLQGVDAALRADHRRLLSPASTFMTPFILQDPLGFKGSVLARLNNLSKAAGYSGVVENNHFISADGRHSLLILDTPVLLTDGFGARKLIGYLTENIKTLPGYVEGKIIAGHLHTISNEDTIQDDIVRTTVIAAVAFFLIFFVVFRDIRAVIFFIIPLAAVVVAIDLTHVFFPVLSYFVIGMGAVIVGIADDYGIHVYVAVHTTKKREAVRQIIKPQLTAAFITCSVFVAFFFSKGSGYHQLAFFAITSIFLCLGFVLFIFPHFLKEGGGIEPAGRQRISLSRLSDSWCIVIWCLIITVLALCCIRFRFSADVTQLDGSSREILAAEEDFKRTWGIKEQPALLVCAGKTEEEALQATEKISQRTPATEESGIIAFTSLWPSSKTRRENVRQWKEFWEKGRKDTLKKFIEQLSPKYHFTPNAFSPFFDGLSEGFDVSEPPENFEFFRRLKEKFVLKRPEGCDAVSFFPDEETCLEKIQAAIKTLGVNAFIVSRKSLARSISEALANEIFFLAVIAGTLILGLTCFLLKKVKFIVIVLVPVVSALAAVFGVFSLLDQPMNAAALFACMLVVGLSIDCGLFTLYDYRHQPDTGTEKAMVISTTTTLIGGFSLLFATHPVLFSIGLTLTAGLSAGFLSSQLVIPALYRRWIVGKGTVTCEE